MGLILGPIIIGYLVVALLVSVWLARTQKRWYFVLLTGALSMLVFILIPTWDEVANRIHFKQLCEKSGGVKVYKTVAISPEYFKEDGSLDLLNKKSQFSDIKIEERYFGKKTRDRKYDERFNIARTVFEIVDVNLNETVGSFTYFVYFGGRAINASGLEVTGKRCPAGPLQLELLLSSVFLKSTTKSSQQEEQ